jgi:hypothetical protein
MEWWSGESSKRFTTVQSRTTSLALVLTQNSDRVEIYLETFGDKTEMRIAAVAASLCRGAPPLRRHRARRHSAVATTLSESN